MTTTIPEPVEIQATSNCRTCHERIRLMLGIWQDDDGCTNCPGDTTTVYAPHQPIPECEVHDQIVPWFEVQEGELCLWAGQMYLLEQMWPARPGGPEAGLTLLREGQSKRVFVNSDALTAVRRYVTEGED